MITCPVCGYDQLEPPLRWKICPSCGTEFGYSDQGRSYDELRTEWIRAGAQWDSTVVKKPRGWNSVTQLHNIAYPATRADPAMIEEVRGRRQG